MVGGEGLPDFKLVLGLLFSGNVFLGVKEEEEDVFFPSAEAGEDDDFPPLGGGKEDEEEDEEEGDFILTISASMAGARVLTTASKSDCVDRDWTADVSSSFLASLSALPLRCRSGDVFSAELRFSRLLLGGDRLSWLHLSSLLLGDGRLSGLLERDR